MSEPHPYTITDAPDPKRKPRLPAKVHMRKLSQAVQMHYVDGVPMVQVARALEVKERTLVDWLKPFKFMAENREAIAHFKANEANVLDGIRWLMTQGMTEQLTDPDRRKSLDLSRLTYGFGVLYDKMRLERGESTVNALSLSEMVRQAHERDVTPKAEEADAEVISEEVPA